MSTETRTELPAQTWTQRLANPTQFMKLSDKLLPVLSILAAAVIAYGLYLTFFVAPPEDRKSVV